MGLLQQKGGDASFCASNYLSDSRRLRAQSINCWPLKPSDVFTRLVGSCAPSYLEVLELGLDLSTVGFLGFPLVLCMVFRVSSP